VSRRTYSGEEIAKALGKWDFQRVSQRGDHLKLRYVDPNTGEKRTVIVPLHDEVATGTLRDIADQAGANDFQEFLDAIEDLV
jgi:predicted RNA binding protein YcfA (HicA-like mRNA interferase family)